MNIPKKLSVFFAAALVLSVLVIYIVPPSNAANEGIQKQEQKTKDNAMNEWKKITPFEIKNPVTLFSKDWAALGVGKKDDMNAMTIAWGTLGELWGKHIITVYVSSSRYTYGFMERYPYFTVSGFPEQMRPALTYLGTHSGRDEKNKVQNAGLTPVFTELGNPFFKEANLVIEAKTIYKAPFNPDFIDKEAKRFYDNGTGIHSMYIGEIINVWEK